VVLLGLGCISFEVFINAAGGMTMRYEGPPWAAIAAKRKLKETEDLFTDWRTRLVEIGERLLREVEKGMSPKK
jgi:hypothetical protein